MEIKKEPLQFNRKKCETVINTSSECDIIIPDTKEDIKDVVNIDSYVNITGSELQNDRILIHGTVSYNIMYLTDTEDKKLRHLSASSAFTDVSDLSGVTNDDMESISSKVKMTDYRILNGRKLSVKSNVETSVSVFEKTETIKASVSQELEGFQNITEQIKIVSFNPPYLKEIELNEKVSIPLSEPSASEILRVYAVISDKNTKIINGKIIVKGEIILSTLYETISTGDIKTINNTVGFTEILDVSGITSDANSNINFDISSLKFTQYDNSEGEIRGADVTIDLLCNVSYYENITLDLIKDCYSTSKKAKKLSESIALSTTVADVDKQLTLKDTVSLSETAPEIKQILNACSKAFITSVETKNDKAVLKGSVDTYLMYMTEGENSLLYSASKTTDFEESFDLPYGTEPEFDLCVNAVNTSFAFRDVKSAEIRCNVEIKGVITGVENKNVIKDIEFEELDESIKNMPTFTVYFVKKGDKLWDIAKRYFTTIKEIKEINEMETENINEGTKLFIPKCREF